MEKLYELLKKLGIELSADQKKQLGEVAEKEFVSAKDAAADKAKLEELTKQLAERDKDLEKLKGGAASEDLKQKLADLTAKYDADTKSLNEKLAAQEQSFAAEKLLSGYKFASERVKNSVLEEFKSKGFKYENGAFVGGKEYLEELNGSYFFMLLKDFNPRHLCRGRYTPPSCESSFELFQSTPPVQRRLKVDYSDGKLFISSRSRKIRSDFVAILSFTPLPFNCSGSTRVRPYCSSC